MILLVVFCRYHNSKTSSYAQVFIQKMLDGGQLLVPYPENFSSSCSPLYAAPQNGSRLDKTFLLVLIALSCLKED